MSVYDGLHIYVVPWDHIKATLSRNLTVLQGHPNFHSVVDIEGFGHYSDVVYFIETFIFVWSTENCFMLILKYQQRPRTLKLVERM